MAHRGNRNHEEEAAGEDADDGQRAAGTAPRAADAQAGQRETRRAVAGAVGGVQQVPGGDQAGTEEKEPGSKEDGGRVGAPPQGSGHRHPRGGDEECGGHLGGKASRLPTAGSGRLGTGPRGVIHLGGELGEEFADPATQQLAQREGHGGKRAEERGCRSAGQCGPRESEGNCGIRKGAGPVCAHGPQQSGGVEGTGQAAGQDAEKRGHHGLRHDEALDLAAPVPDRQQCAQFGRAPLEGKDEEEARQDQRRGDQEQAHPEEERAEVHGL
ncbi:MAG: hypothetical protein BWZ02_02640 [Lentisphaerae bacterium ADurb.BinA184]|nr:MAG: hypothetical protein BWZ02_02640 [Lentisphaerae bacterium ADurb.BinA184]